MKTTKTRVILIKDCIAGKADTILDVRHGYAKNFLLPQRLALLYTPQNQRLIEELRQERLKKIEEEKLEAQKLKEKLETLELHFVLQRSYRKTHGVVSSKQIYNKLEESFSIKLPHHALGKVLLKEGGQHLLKVELAHKIEAKLKVVVEIPNPPAPKVKRMRMEDPDDDEIFETIYFKEPLEVPLNTREPKKESQTSPLSQPPKVSKPSVATATSAEQTLSEPTQTTQSNEKVSQETTQTTETTETTETKEATASQESTLSQTTQTQETKSQESETQQSDSQQPQESTDLPSEESKST